jgi:hypothetical protein
LLQLCIAYNKIPLKVIVNEVEDPIPIFLSGSAKNVELYISQSKITVLMNLILTFVYYFIVWCSLYLKTKSKYCSTSK